MDQADASMVNIETVSSVTGKETFERARRYSIIGT